MITPLPAALELYELKAEIKAALFRLFWNSTNKEDESMAHELIEKILAIDLKYPTNENGIVIKERK